MTSQTSQTTTAEPVVAGDAGPSPFARDLRTRWLPRLAGYLVFLTFWSWASGNLISAALLPSPLDILEEMRMIVASGELWVHFGSTLRKIAIGYVIAFAVGAGIGIAMRHRWWDGFFRDWVVTTMTTPGLVFALIAAMVFGFSPEGPIVAIVATTFPFFTVNIAEGVKALPKDLFDMANAFGVNSRRRMRHVVIPFLAPYIFAAMRYGFSIAWKIATLTELFGSSRGIGFMMRREFQLFNMSALLAWIFFFFAFALLLEKLVLQRGMNRFFRWRQTVAT